MDARYEKLRREFSETVNEIIRKRKEMGKKNVIIPALVLGPDGVLIPNKNSF